MKIRIQGNSIRIRLSKSEVDKLASDGYLEEKTSFGQASFRYCLERKPGLEALHATFYANTITLYVPEKLLVDWPTDQKVGFEAYMPVNEKESLYLLVEKDFRCLDQVTEDQSDNYENPNKTC